MDDDGPNNIKIVTGFLILRKAKEKARTWMGLAVLILGFGDAFHLVPRIMDHFSSDDFTTALGVGKLITSITMTIFYVLVYCIGCTYFERNIKKDAGIGVCLRCRIFFG